MHVWIHAWLLRFHHTVLAECDCQLYIMLILHLSLWVFLVAYDWMAATIMMRRCLNVRHCMWMHVALTVNVHQDRIYVWGYETLFQTLILSCKIWMEKDLCLLPLRTCWTHEPVPTVHRKQINVWEVILTQQLILQPDCCLLKSLQPVVAEASLGVRQSFRVICNHHWWCGLTYMMYCGFTKRGCDCSTFVRYAQYAYILQALSEPAVKYNLKPM